MMSTVIKEIVGKIIKGIIVKESGKKNPTSQVFLLFHDDTYYELYCDSVISGAKKIIKGDMNAIKKNMPDNEIIFEYEI